MMYCRIIYYFEIIIFLWRLGISAKLNVLNCQIHVNMRWLIVTLRDVKL